MTDAGRGHRWRGGRHQIANGYIVVWSPGHRLAMKNGYVYEHRLVAETIIGRPLEPGEEVHHINSDRTDNRPENLEVVAGRLAHMQQHRKRAGRRLYGEPNPEIPCECGCGETLRKYDEDGRPRKYVNTGHYWRGRSRKAAA